MSDTSESYTSTQHPTPNAPKEAHIWHIRPFQAGDEAQLLNLFKRTFGKPRTLEDWRWKFGSRQAPFPSPLIWVAEIPGSGRLVGHYAGIPLHIKLGDLEVGAMLSVETMTDPDFRKQGMLTQFGGIVYPAWASAGQELVVGLPNQQWGSRTRALGWVPLFPLCWLRFPLHLERAVSRRSRRRLPYLPSKAAYLPLMAASGLWRYRSRRIARGYQKLDKIRVEKIRAREASSIFDQIWKHAAPTWQNAVVRDSDWVRWRYLEAQPAPYCVAVAYSGVEPVGYIAYKATEVNKQTKDALPRNSFIPAPNTRLNGHIADLFVARGDLATATALVMAAFDDLSKQGAGMALALAVPGSFVYGVLRRLGFLRTSDAAAFSVDVVPLSSTVSTVAITDPTLWQLAGGDFDVI